MMLAGVLFEILPPPLFPPREIPAGECFTAPLTDQEIQPHCQAAPLRLALSTRHRGASAMTQRTFRFVWWLLMILSATLSVVLVVFLQVSS